MRDWISFTLMRVKTNVNAFHLQTSIILIHKHGCMVGVKKRVHSHHISRLYQFSPLINHHSFHINYLKYLSRLHNHTFFHGVENQIIPRPLQETTQGNSSSNTLLDLLIYKWQQILQSYLDNMSYEKTPTLTIFSVTPYSFFP